MVGRKEREEADTEVEMFDPSEVFDPSEFEEPELYESMKILKSLETLRRTVQKKTNVLDLKKSIKRGNKKEQDKIKSKLKRPYLDLEKMMKVKISYHSQTQGHSLTDCNGHRLPRPIWTSQSKIPSL